MKPRDRKRYLLHLISKESEPISISALMVKLDNYTNERTLRRWLNSLIEEGLVVKTGTTKSTKYLVKKNHPKEEKAQKISSCFSTQSLKALSKIHRPLFERMPCSYNIDWFQAYIPNKTYYIPLQIRKQLHQVGKRSGDHDPAGTYAHQIFNRLLIDLSYNSSRLEGNTYSLLDTERLINYGDVPEGKLDEEKIMILNHKEAIRYLVEQAPSLNVETKSIYTLHYLLSEGLLEPRYAGKVRDYQVKIGGSTYQPYDDQKVLNKQLENICSKAASILDPFEQALFLLIHISYLQAFADVNKRTARLSANIPLITKNLVPLSFNDVNREDYISAMISIYEIQNIRPLLDIFVFSYLRTCAAYDATVKSIGVDVIRVRYRSQRRAAIREVITQEMPKSKIAPFLKKIARQFIPEKEQEEFIQDIYEDLELISPERIVGLGISLDQLETWLKKRQIGKK